MIHSCSQALHMPDAPELAGRLKYMLLMTKKALPCAENKKGIACTGV